MPSRALPVASLLFCLLIAAGSPKGFASGEACPECSSAAGAAPGSPGLTCAVPASTNLIENIDQVCARKSIAELALWVRGFESCLGERAELTVDSIAGMHGNNDRQAKAKSLLAEPDDSPVWREILSQPPQGVSRQKAIQSIRASIGVMARNSPRDAFLLDTYTGSGYVRINRILRSGGKNAECLRPLVREIVRVYRQFPAYQGTIWRGLILPEEALREYRDGAVLSWPAFSSTSVDRKVAEHYADGHGSGTGVVFEIQSKNCLDIRAINGLQEDEILCMPGTRVKVKAHKNSNVIVLEEV